LAEFHNNFKSLPDDFQNLLRLAQEKLKIEVTPLQELKGGRTGAYLFLVSVSRLPSNRIDHLILKLDHKSKKTKMDELERHNLAIKEAPEEFVRNHIADLAFERIETDEAVVIFYSIAGHSLNNYHSLADYQQQTKLEIIFSTTGELLLSKWNSDPKFEKAVHPQKVIAKWLGYRLQPGGNIEHFIQDNCCIHPDMSGLMIQGNIFPNPLVFARKTELWEKVRPIDNIVGFQHGDLNIGNILAKFDENKNDLTGYYLIDFALFKSGMPLFYDLCYLEVSYLIRELSRMSFVKWVDMVCQFAEQDIPDPHKVPIELSGACAVVGAGRKSFKNWLQRSHPSLSDDLWGQFWLAAVAAGLNYCNKSGINENEKLAGLIYAAAHLKRYHKVFRVPLPVEVKHLDIENKSLDTANAGAGAGYTKSPQHNLPSQVTPFIGRQKELAATTELLKKDESRLVTLTGPGGTGKTRLAVQAGRNLIDRFKDGVYFVDLAPVREPEAALAAIGNTIGIRESGNRPLIDELKSKLQSKKLLLLLDNFEQVTSAAPKIGELMLGCPLLKLLITSREGLHLRGEHIFPVPPLGLPHSDFKQQSIEILTQFEAVRLFIDRAVSVKPDFEFTTINAPAVAGLCIRLDGLPLAIELAAARIKLFSPETLLKKVESSLKLLRGGACDLPARQQTLRDTIDWSYQLLNIEEQRLFALLAVFSGFTFESVENVVSKIKLPNETDPDVLDGLTSLIDKSLIRSEDQNSGVSRLMMLETIREYAAERLNENSEFAASAYRAHAEYFADFSDQLWKLLTGPERDKTLMEIEPHIENMKSAWRYWISDKNIVQLQKLTNSLWVIYDAKGRYFATVDLTTDLLNVLKSVPSTPELAQQEIMLQTSLGRVLMAIKGCTPQAEEAYNRALELCQKHGEIPRSFSVLRALASFYVYIADFEKSKDFGKQILNLADKINDVNIRAEGGLVYGYSLIFSGKPKQGLEYLQNAVSDYNPDSHNKHSFRFGNNTGVTCHTTSALCLWMLGYPDRALKSATDSIALANKLNHPFSLAYAMFHTGLLYLWMQKKEIVQERAQAVLEIADKHEFQIWKAVASCLEGSALAAMGQAEIGLAEFKQGIDMYTELKTPPVFWPLLLVLYAGTYIQAGQSQRGLELIDEALNLIGQASENPLNSELYRLKGDVLLMVSMDNSHEAESLFRKALILAKEQQTGMFELRAAMSLSRLWSQQAKMKEGKKILKEAYDKFTEGFTTADLVEAKKLLEASASTFD
jgi:predicted ATPase